MCSVLQWQQVRVCFICTWAQRTCLDPLTTCSYIHFIEVWLIYIYQKVLCLLVLLSYSKNRMFYVSSLHTNRSHTQAPNIKKRKKWSVYYICTFLKKTTNKDNATSTLMKVSFSDSSLLTCANCSSYRKKICRRIILTWDIIAFNTFETTVLSFFYFLWNSELNFFFIFPNGFYNRVNKIVSFLSIHQI